MREELIIRVGVAFLVLMSGSLMLISERPLVFSAVLWGLLSILVYNDIKFLRLPNLINGLVFLAGLVFHFQSNNSLWLPIAGSVLAFLFLLFLSYLFQKVRKKQGIGGGDIKLFAAGAVWLSPFQLPLVLLIASSFALIVLVTANIFTKENLLLKRFAFGPFLSFGIWIIWLFGQEFMQNL